MWDELNGTNFLVCFLFLCMLSVWNFCWFVLEPQSYYSRCIFVAMRLKTEPPKWVTLPSSSSWPLSWTGSPITLLKCWLPRILTLKKRPHFFGYHQICSVYSASNSSKVENENPAKSVLSCLVPKVKNNINSNHVLKENANFVGPHLYTRVLGLLNPENVWLAWLGVMFQPKKKTCVHEKFWNDVFCMCTSEHRAREIREMFIWPCVAISVGGRKKLVCQAAR